MIYFEALLGAALALVLAVSLAVELALLPAVGPAGALAAFEVSGVKLVACCATCEAVELNAFCPPTTFAVVAYELASCTIESGL